MSDEEEYKEMERAERNQFDTPALVSMDETLSQVEQGLQEKIERMEHDKERLARWRRDVAQMDK